MDFNFQEIIRVFAEDKGQIFNNRSCKQFTVFVTFVPHWYNICHFMFMLHVHDLTLISVDKVLCGGERAANQ